MTAARRPNATATNTNAGSNTYEFSAPLAIIPSYAVYLPLAIR